LALPARFGPHGGGLEMMRYRSATVADFHGLPLFPRSEKEPEACEFSRKHLEASYQHI
jgi:hypothetical protein